MAARPSPRPLVVLGGALLGAIVGVLVGRELPGEDGAADLRASVARSEQTIRDLRSELAAARAADARAGPRARVVSANPVSDPSSAVVADDVAGDVVAVPDAAAFDVAAPDDEGRAADRAARVAMLKNDVPVWFEQGDGEAALEGLRRLAALAPEGREAAMDLALRINDDVNGEGRLRLSDVAFYTGLGDAAVKGLMDWALPRDDTPPGFRVMAAYSLPWTQSPAATLEQFRVSLGTERDPTVQRALIANLGRLRSPSAERLLADVLADPGRDAMLRAEAAGALATSDDPGVERVLEIAADKDPDPTVRAAARAASVARHPPATGYLVTGTLPESQAAAAGLLAGDILVRYQGRDVPTGDALREATEAATGDDLVPIVVVRGGAEMTLLVRPGRLGVYGRSVQAEER